MPNSPGQYGEPQPFGEAVSQVLGGVPVYRGESREAKEQRLSPTIERHAALADDYLSQVEDQAHHLPNPYVGMVREKDSGSLSQLLRAARGYLKQQLKNGANFSPRGLTAEGKQRLRRAYLWQTAIADRLDELE